MENKLIVSRDVVGVDVAESRSVSTLDYCNEAARVVMAMVREHQLSGKTDTSTVLGLASAIQIGVSLKVIGNDFCNKKKLEIKSDARKNGYYR